MLLVRVDRDLGLVEKFDPRPYTNDWFLHRDEERYLGFLLARSHEVRRHWKAILFSFALAAVSPMPGLCRALIR